MHYNNLYDRQLIIEKTGLEQKGILSFVNLCIYPYDFATIYHRIQERDQIQFNDYEALKGAITALLVLIKRKNRNNNAAVDIFVVDFVNYIRSDTKTRDPLKFLMSINRYLPRYLCVSGLNYAFGIDWKTLVVETLDLNRSLEYSSYHSLFTNLYIRSLMMTFVAWKNFRYSHEEGYEYGVNDIDTLLTKAASYKKSLSRDKIEKLFDRLLKVLPSWNVQTRRKVGWSVDTMQDGWYIINRPSQDWMNYDNNDRKKCIKSRLESGE